MLHIGTLSSGAASAYTCKLMLDEVGKKDSLMIFTDTLWEDADNYRFLTDIVKHLDAPFKRLAVGKNPLELAWEHHALPNNRFAFCSQELKREPLEDYIKENCSNQDVTIWWGIDIEEKHRAVKIEANWLANFNIKSRFPLIENLTPRYEVFDWLESINIKPPIMYEQKFSHANCFSGDTRFITKNGIKTFQETVGNDVKVVGTYGNWVDASVKNFGNQEIVELTLERLGKTKVIKTTANHEWFVWKGNRCKVHTTKTTNELEVNDRLRVVIPKGLSKNVELSPWGIAHGIVYGDGSASNHHAGWITPARLRLCGDKKELLKYFPLSNTKVLNNGDIEVKGLSRTWKKLPSLTESRSYLLGWLAGYLAADGSVSKQGSTIHISCADKNILDFVKHLALILGIHTNSITSRVRLGINDVESEIHKINFSTFSLVDNFFLRTKHKERFSNRIQNADHKISIPSWRVVSIKPTGITEPVFCCVVPDGNAFTLEDNILTHNCGGRCVRAGLSHWAHLYKVNPERYKEVECLEQKWQHDFQKNNTILRKSGKPISLRDFRINHIEGGVLFPEDVSDGACGCMATFEGDNT